MRALFLVLPLTACVGLDPTVPSKNDDTAADTDSGVSAGALAADLSTVDFGNVTVGMSSDRALTLSNLGDGNLRVAAVLDGDGGFTIDQTTVPLPGGSEAILTIGFLPSFTGDYVSTLTLSPTDGSESISIPVLGAGVEEGDTGGGNGGGNGGDNGSGNGGGNGGDTGTAEGGSIAVTPSSYDYGTLDLGDSAYTSFTVKNNGSGNLDVTSVSLSDSSFTVTGGTLITPAVLSPGSSKTVQVSFSPSAERHYAGTVTIASDDSANPTTTLSVTGDGADLCDVCAPLITVDTGGDPYSVNDFFSFYGSADTRTWQINNDGDQDLVISDVYVNNDAFAPCGTFTMAAWSSTTVRPGASTRASITFRASSACIEVPNPSFDMNVVHILSNDPSQSDYVVEIGGAAL